MHDTLPSSPIGDPEDAASGPLYESSTSAEERLRFEQLLSALAARLINLSAQAARDAIRDALQLIGEFAGADEVRLLTLREPGSSGEVAAAWVADGTAADLACSSMDFFGRFPVAEGLLRSGQPMMYGSLREIPPNAEAERSYLQQIGLLAAIAYPVMVDDRLQAVLFVHSFRERRWPDILVERLPHLSAILGNALAREAAELRVAEQLEFERLLADVSSAFTNPSPEEIDDAIDRTLKRIGMFFDADRAFIMRLGAASQALGPADELSSHNGITYGWASDAARDIDPLLAGAAFDELFPWMTQQMRRGRIMQLRPKDLPAEAGAEFDYVRKAGVAIGTLVPLRVGGCVDAMMALDAYTDRPHWTPELAARLQLVGEIIASAMKRRQQVLALHERDQLLLATLERAPAGVAVADADGVLVEANPSFCAMLGFAKHELLGLTVERITHAEDAHLTEHAMQALRSGTETACTYEKRYLRKDGSPLWVQVVVSDLRDEHGALQNFVAVAVDMTTRRAAEQQLKQALAELRALKERLEAENELLRDEIELRHVHEGITGNSPAIREVKAAIERVGPTDTTVLITGETGTGKEVVAAALHRLSGRSHRPLIKVNCAALPEPLIEAELFGREKGAYTGALTRQAGRFEIAHQGTLFLDEIGELPPTLQSKLLRVIQEGTFERLGSTSTIEVDVRLIVATNRDLEAAMREGRFREDLFYRLNVFPIRLPALRERPEDIPALVWSLIEECCEASGRRIRSVPAKDMARLQTCPWPGNVRELRNLIERALILCDGETLHIEPRGNRAPDPVDRNTDETLAAIERAHIAAVLKRTDWRIRGDQGAAAILGLKPTTLEYRIAKLGLRRPLKTP